MQTQSTAGLLLPDLETLAVSAGREILDVYSTDFKVAVKADASSVTEADTRAEAVILEGLARLSPCIPVVAEEQVAAGHVPDAAPCFYLVDPLDGTREFISRNGEFTVNIALVEDGVPVAGVVYAPALGVLYSGAAGLGAFRRDVTEGVLGPAAPIAVRQAPAEGIAAVASRSHADPATDQWLSCLSVSSVHTAGSSLKFGLVAEGRADVYPRLGRTMEWDTAAGDAVLRAAGGLVTRLDGTPLVYGKDRQGADAPYANPHFVAYGDRRLVELAAARAG
ncbi:3'(2'),5'-bisphosphate nucleotidase CysQ [Aquabacter sp. CN5-332]|uniref:3'(2'),5'-bisphosphate nucleotidase CysQ n=1 Tax=Aquabacter sp. CN5-332 TaxID=3156608 RepID=UPI0032B39056